MLPVTEQENPNTVNIDKASTLEAVRLINDEDKKVALAVEKVLPEIAETVDNIVERLKNGGRLFYVGTGTSGRLGVLDASEIPPTYGVSYDLVQGVIAGGYDALYKATEASEDNREAGRTDLQKRGLTEKDAVLGIAASGRTPYTIGAISIVNGLPNGLTEQAIAAARGIRFEPAMKNGVPYTIVRNVEFSFTMY